MFTLPAHSRDAQQPHWEKMFALHPDMFGTEPSAPAHEACRLFVREGVQRLLELGAGQGRDTLLFARQGLAVEALDYAETGLAALRHKAAAASLPGRITTTCHDVRQPLPFAENSIDACFAHMLFCMALTPEEVQNVFDEVLRVLKPGGLCVYTVRHTQDPHFGQGTPCGHNMYKVGGFMVHFFSRETVQQYAKKYILRDISLFEEGQLPRQLFKVILQKP